MVRKITKWHLMLPFLHDYRRYVILADMERELGVPHQTLSRYARELVRDKIFLEERKPKNIVYSINADNPMALNYISYAEKLALEDALAKSSLLKRLFEMISPCMHDNNFLVFGSFARNLRGNDMDLLAVGKNEKTKEIIKKFEKTYGKQVHLIQLDKFPPGKTMLKEVLDKHIIFNGFDSFIKAFWDFVWKK